MTATLAPVIRQRFFDHDGNPLALGTLATYAAGSAHGTPKATWKDYNKVALNTNPVILDADGYCDLWLDNTTPYELVLKDAAGNTIFDTDNVFAPGAEISGELAAFIAQYNAFKAALLAGTGGALVGFIQNSGNAIARTMLDKVREAVVTPQDFNAKGDNATNDTVAMLNFFNFCIATGARGHIKKGIYLINAGSLAFDNGHVEKAWPFITTDGEDAVTLRFATNVDAPMITISNGTAVGPGSYDWKGGCLGGFTVDDGVVVSPGGSNRHALSVLGAWNIRFGWVRANSIAGSAIYIPNKMLGGTNPDPYAVTRCTFEGAEANYCAGRSVSNYNGAGLNFCDFNCIRTIGTQLGGLYGLGASNHFNFLTMSCSGWAVYDGLEGTVDRSYITDLELDNVQYGVRLNQVTSVEIKRCRVIPRFQTAPNVAAVYWPLTAFEIGASAAPTVRNVKIDVIFRVEAGGGVPDLGKFFDFNNTSGATELEINFIDVSPFTIPDASFVSVFNYNSRAKIVRNGREIVNSLFKAEAGASYAGALSVPNVGYGSNAAILAFNSERYDPQGCYDPATYAYTAPRNGRYNVLLTLGLTAAIATRVRLAVWLAPVSGGASTIIASRTRYQVNAGSQSYEIAQTVNLVQGDKIYAMADQNTGAPINASATVPEAEVVFQIEEL